MSGLGVRDASTSAPSCVVNVRPSQPIRSTLPSSLTVSISIRIVSPSRTRPIGPPASPSGPTWPIHAPVLTPLNRASVIRATCFPHSR